MADAVRIGCWAGAWGDTRYAAAGLVRRGEVDFLVADYLAEVTMALLARRRETGFIPDAIAVLAPLLDEIEAQGIKVVTNAGGLNPRAFRDALAATGLKVAVVEGDDISGHPGLPPDALTANAYLGARPIAAALDAGADIVVTGRCVDSALVLGPLLHAFGWGDDDHDLLSAGSLIGHILECGAQATGGLFTDWADVPRWEDMGAPIAECRPDGTATITKTPGSGGMVTPATVAEQIVYEIGDPGAYLLADVCCDWRDVRLDAAGEDAVSVSGARGAPPPRTYKATVTTLAGFRAIGTVMLAGFEAGGKARRTGEAVVARVNRLLGDDAPLAHSSIEVIGAGDVHGARDDGARDVVLKVGVRDPRRHAVDLFSRELPAAGLSMGQGLTGAFAGRPKVAPAIAVTSLLIDKTTVTATVDLDGAPVAVPPPPAGTEREPTRPATQPGSTSAHTGDPVPLRAIAHGRSGDKGNDVNIGIIARRPEDLPRIRAQVTPQRVAQHFAHYGVQTVDAWELPGLHAINFLLRDALGGAGGTTSLRYDAQGKSFAAMLLELTV